MDNKGNRLVFMAGTNVRYIADEDMHALIAFLRSQEPVEKESLLPPDRPNFLAVLMLGANMIPEQPLVTEPILAPKKEATAEYGKFMTRFLDCKNCHGDDLNGGTSSTAPKGPSLRLVRVGRKRNSSPRCAQAWTRADMN